MPSLEPHAGNRARAQRVAAVVRTVALAAILFLPVAVFAGWLDRLTTARRRQAAARRRQCRAHSRMLLDMCRRCRPRSTSWRWQRKATQEGHWRFVNRAGEMFTVGTPDEMKRVVSVLYPEAKAGARLSLYMTEDTIFRDRAALKTLPANAELFVVVAARRAIASCGAPTARSSACSPRCVPIS